ncbi:MAG: M23 family metallopeptidase, partial [bacterium]
MGGSTRSLIALRNHFLLLSLQAFFVYPLPDFPDNLTSSFGEYRTGHLHAGLDIGTGGETGHRVLAAADGQVVRLKSERRGYGRVVYIQHDNGYITVYAHLEEFAPKIKAAVPSSRYFDLLLGSPLPVKKGEIIALSGESGAGLPHLHFEVRRGFGQPVEPFSAGLEKVKESAPI